MLKNVCFSLVSRPRHVSNLHMPHTPFACGARAPSTRGSRPERAFCCCFPRGVSVELDTSSTSGGGEAPRQPRSLAPRGPPRQPPGAGSRGPRAPPRQPPGAGSRASRAPPRQPPGAGSRGPRAHVAHVPPLVSRPGPAHVAHVPPLVSRPGPAHVAHVPPLVSFPSPLTWLTWLTWRNQSPGAHVVSASVCDSSGDRAPHAQDDLAAPWSRAL